MKDAKLKSLKHSNKTTHAHAACAFSIIAGEPVVDPGARWDRRNFWPLARGPLGGGKWFFKTLPNRQHPHFGPGVHLPGRCRAAAAAVTLWAKQKRNEQNVKNDDAAAKGLSERLGQMVRKFRFPPNAEPPLP